MMVGLTVTVGGCMPAPSTSPSPSPSVVVGSPDPTASDPAASVPPASGSPSTAASGPVVAIDPSLLDVLPDTVDGLALDYDPVATAETARDPELAANAEAIAYAIAASPDGTNFVVPVVTMPRSGLFDEAFFRGWRDSFDEAACAQAGGVAGHAQAELGGRTVFIATCDGGLVLHHTYLGTRGVLVSVSSLGERRLGEKLMTTLRDR